MPNEISQRIKLLNPGNLDDWYGPYDSIAMANATAPTAIRLYKTVGIVTDDGIVEYWWKYGATDEDLIIKQSEYEEHFKGSFLTLTALQQAYPTAVPGDYADVDAGEDEPVKRYIWDSSDSEWILGSGGPVSFSNLTGSPYDNASLGEELNNIDSEITEIESEITSINTDLITLEIFKASNYATP